MPYSKELIQKTLDLWQPKYDTIGVKLTEEDAREILNNMTGLVLLLADLDKKYSKEDTIM
jgi:hypothetical protein